MDSGIFKVILVDDGGVEHELLSPEGYRLMEVIRDNDFPIKAECNGCLSCATCHIYVLDEQYLELLEPQSQEEINMLDEAFFVEDNSRLSCQILISQKIDGIRVKLAPLE